jgi:hypothetical protein
MFLFRIIKNNAEESTILSRNTRMDVGTLIEVALEDSHGSTVHPKNKLKQFQEERQPVLKQKLLFQPQRQIQKLFSMKISIK